MNDEIVQERRTQRREGGNNEKHGGYGPRDQEHRHFGKAREEAHPFDRKSGTGAGKKDVKKGGHGKFNLGTDAEVVEGETKAETTQEETKEHRPRRERRERVEEPVPEKVESEEEEGFTLQDYLN